MYVLKSTEIFIDFFLKQIKLKLKSTVKFKFELHVCMIVHFKV